MMSIQVLRLLVLLLTPTYAFHAAAPHLRPAPRTTVSIKSISNFDLAAAFKSLAARNSNHYNDLLAYAEDNSFAATLKALATRNGAKRLTAEFKPLAAAGSFATGKGTPTTITCDTDADGCLAICDEENACSIVAPIGLVQRLKIGLYFALWFVLSVGYSISNKKVNNLLGGCAFSVATSTVAVGSVFVSALWVTGLRSAPRVPLAALRTLLPIGLCHALGHLLGTYSVAAGTVSFTQIVKAANPVYVCVLSTILLRQAVSLRVWLSLIPIVGGVALATVKERSFVWAALIAASASDLSMAIRNVLSKKSMGVLTDVNGRYLSTADMFGLLTVISTLLSLPFAIAIDGHALPKLWSAAAATTAGGSGGLAALVGLAGLLFYLYNEAAMKALSSVHPVTHAVGNILRRVVLIVASMVVFGTRMSPLCVVGSGLAIGGSFAYAMVKHEEKVRASSSGKRK